MGALSPLFLLAGVAIGVPIFLHLFQRHQTRRVSFPALRYLERTEREHAKQIRLRQLLLLLARVAALLLIVLAGARLFFAGRGASHPPTAVVVILDNSMSSGRVTGEVRVLDELKAAARAVLAEANDEDLFWVLRAGEPWTPAIPGDRLLARTAVDETEPTAAAGDLTAALERAEQLLASTDLAETEIHLLSDLQRSAFAVPGTSASREIPVIVWTGSISEIENRSITHVTVGGGLAPLEGQRGEVTVGALPGTDTTRVPLRIVVNERIRGALSLAPGVEASVTLPPSGSGWVTGYADADPDVLRADDRRYFAYRSRSAPTVAVGGDPGLFVSEAIGVLVDAGRIVTGQTASADAVLSSAGEGLAAAATEAAVIVIPPADISQLPAVNRRLAEGGIPWTLSPRGAEGSTELTGLTLPGPLEGVRVDRGYRLERSGDSSTPTRTLAEAAGFPWAVEGQTAAGRRYLLIASPLSTTATSLPVSTGMLRFVDWATGTWAGAGGSAGERIAGSRIAAPSGADVVRTPAGTEHPIDGTRTIRETGMAGLYTFAVGDSVVSIVAVNPPVEESLLEPLQEEVWPEVLGAEAIPADDEASWIREVFRARQGPELWRGLLVTALLLLLLESLIAASGEATREREPARVAATPTDAAA